MPEEVNNRIDDVLRKNRSHEIIIIIMAIMIFILGAVSLGYGIFYKETIIVLPATLISAVLYWPIYQIKKIRKDNVTLAAVPTLIATLPPEDAARELIKLLEKLT